MSSPATPSLGLIALALGLMTLIGPASVDMYLPFMPTMAQELGTNFSAMQMTLAIFLAALGLGQLVFGPVIDAYGRRKPLLMALCVFVVASLAAAYAQSLNALLLARAVQGLAASLVLVTAMSTVRDVAEGARAAQLFATLMTIQGVGPVIAPAIGGVIGSSFGWRGVFIALAILGLFVVCTSTLMLKETLPVSARSSIRPSEVLRTYGSILKDGRFVLAGLTLAALFIFIFSYVGGAAYVYQNHYDISPKNFGFVFGGTGIAVFLGAAATAKLVSRYRIEHLAILGAGLVALGGAITLLSAIVGWGLPGIVAGCSVSLAGLGVAESVLMSIALSLRTTALGASAALLGALPILLGAAITPVAAAAAEQGPAAWTGLLLGVALVSLLLSVLTARMVARSGVAVSAAHG